MGQDMGVWSLDLNKRLVYLIFEIIGDIKVVLDVLVSLKPSSRGYSKKFYTGRLRSLAQPLLHTIFEGKDTPFVSWYPFHIPSLELCFPFDCCKCSVFIIYKTITKPERFPDFFHSH